MRACHPQTTGGAVKLLLSLSLLTATQQMGGDIGPCRVPQKCGNSTVKWKFCSSARTSAACELQLLANVLVHDYLDTLFGKYLQIGIYTNTEA